MCIICSINMWGLGEENVKDKKVEKWHLMIASSPSPCPHSAFSIYSGRQGPRSSFAELSDWFKLKSEEFSPYFLLLELHCQSNTLQQFHHLKVDLIWEPRARRMPRRAHRRQRSMWRGYFSTVRSHWFGLVTTTGYDPKTLLECFRFSSGSTNA